jgi:hypothetical protein
MSLIISLTVASALGTLLGNLGLFWVIGMMAQKQQEAQQKKVAELQEEFLKMRQREAERMHRYAQMES